MNQEASHLYAKAEQLRRGDKNARHELRKTYKQLLVDHLAYSLEKKVEADLWTSFKEEITDLQKACAKSAKDRTAPSSKCVLDCLLETAQGFYSVLLLEVKVSAAAGSRNHFDYINQHVLVHLGDLARYRSAGDQAEWFYRKAIVQCPAYGHAYNQVSLLESAKGKVLSAVYFYVRSMAVEHSFTIASANLAKMYERVLSPPKSGSPAAAVGHKSFVSLFLQLHAHLHQAINIKTKASKLCWKVTQKLTSEIATEALTAAELVQMVAITLYQLHQMAPVIEQTDDEKHMRSLLVETLAGMLNSFLLPVYTIKADDTMASHFTLPAAKLILQWLLQNPDVLGEPSFKRRMQIWPSLCKLLNEFKTASSDDISTSDDLLLTLPEDLDIKCFAPIGPLGKAAKASQDHSQDRRQHFLHIGRLLAETVLTVAEEGGQFGVRQTERSHTPDADELSQMFAGFEAASTSASGSEEEDEEEQPSSSSVSSLSLKKSPAVSSSSTTPSPLSSSRAEVIAGGIIKKPQKPSKNAAMSAIMRRLEQQETKPKVQFDVPTTAAPAPPAPTNRFVGINGPPQIMGGDHHQSSRGTMPGSFPAAPPPPHRQQSHHHHHQQAAAPLPPPPPPNFSVPPPPPQPTRNPFEVKKDDFAPFGSGRFSGLPPPPPPGAALSMQTAAAPHQLGSLLPSALPHQQPQQPRQHHGNWPQLPPRMDPLLQQPRQQPSYSPLPIGSQRPGQQQSARPYGGVAHLQPSNSTPTSLQNVSNNNIQQLSGGGGIWSTTSPAAAADHHHQSAAAAAMKNAQHLLFQPGPSTLEKLLQQNRQSNK